MGLREGDIEAIRQGMRDMGRPVKSNMLVEKDGTKVYYEVSKKGKVKIIDKDT